MLVDAETSAKTDGELLSLESIEVSYGPVRALFGISLSVGSGETVALIGPNGAGKSSVLHAIIGLRRPNRGRIRYKGHDITGLPTQQRIRLGMALVPEHRRILATLTVEENLLVGGMILPRRLRQTRANEMIERFEVLKRKRSQQAGVLSGGEAQQLAIARALMPSPELLLMDEPTLGLAPLVAAQVFGLIKELRERGMTLIVVDQNPRRVLNSADSAYLIRTGHIVQSGSADQLATREDLFGSFLGGSPEDSGVEPMAGPAVGSRKTVETPKSGSDD